MGLMGVLKSFTHVIRNGANISDVKADTGGGRITTAENFSPAGDDSFPLLTDIPFIVPAPGTGRFVVLGYLDPINEGQALEGERRFIARDSSGAPVSFVWLRNDGSLELNGAGDYAVRYTPLEEQVHQLRDDLNAFIQAYLAHIHTTTATIGSSGTPGVISPTASTVGESSIDISPAKVDMVKLP